MDELEAHSSMWREKVVGKAGTRQEDMEIKSC